jgi:predicted PurR-regulated permease PerM
MTQVAGRRRWWVEQIGFNRAAAALVIIGVFLVAVIVLIVLTAPFLVAEMVQCRARFGGTFPARRCYLFMSIDRQKLALEKKLANYRELARGFPNGLINEALRELIDEAEQQLLMRRK